MIEPFSTNSLISIDTLGKMASVRLQSEYARRKLAALEATVEALLYNNTPFSPIVKEKIQQVEDILVEVPLDDENVTEIWRKKLTQWWIRFAIQQIESKAEAMKFLMPRIQPFNDAIASTSAGENFYLLPKQSPIEIMASLISKRGHQSQLIPKVSSSTSESEPATVPLPKANPSHQVLNNLQRGSAPEVSGTISISSKECISANAVIEKSKVVPPSCTTAIMPERKSTFELAPHDLELSSAQKAPVSAPTAPKERRLSNSSKDRPENAAPVSSELFSLTAHKPKEIAPPTATNNVGHQTPASTVTKSEPVFEPVSNDFDWGSGPVAPVAALGAPVVHNERYFSSTPKSNVIPPSTSTRPTAVVPERKSTFQPVSEDFNRGSAPFASKERQPSGSSQNYRPAARIEAVATNVRPSNAAPAPIVHNDRFSSFAQKPKETAPPTGTNYGGHPARASTVAESERVFERVPADFDWGSAPVN